MSKSRSSTNAKMKPARAGTQSIERVVDILRYLAAGDEAGVRIADIVVYLKLEPGTAHRILNRGFEDEPSKWGGAVGVLLTNLPLDENEGRLGDEQLLVEIPANVISEYEIVSLELSVDEAAALSESGYREWLVPSQIVNGHARVTVIAADDDDR